MAGIAAVEVVAVDRSLRLAEMLAARLCHDLAGGLSTVSNAFALVRQDPDDTEALAIAAEASQAAVARLRLLRAAWAGTGEAMSLAELRLLAVGLERHRLAVRLDALAPGLTFAPEPARLVLNVLLLGAESLPRGGVLTLAGDGPDEVLTTIAGPGAGWPAGFAACLADRETAWAHLTAALDGAGAGLLCGLTALIAHESGLRVSILMAAAPHPAPPLLLRLSAAAA